MMRKMNSLLDYFKYLNNPIEALRFKFGLINHCNIKIKSKNDTVMTDNVIIIDKLMDKLPLTPSNKYDELMEYINDLNNDVAVVSIDGIRYFNTLNSEFIKNSQFKYNACNDEYFSDDEWNMVDFNNRFVIDIGGNVADTALDFAKKGATIIAFEPVKHLYELGIKNIKLNPDLKDKITFINKAVGAKKGTIDITADSLKSYAEYTTNYEIEVITIDDILNDYSAVPDILKMDCEGCEFEIIPNFDFSQFNDVIFEHHAKMTGKDYKPLIEKLKNEGFEINTYPCNASRRDFDEIGIIHAFQ